MLGRDLSGQLALVTGGAKGVGKLVAEMLAQRGARLIINYFHSLEAAKQTRAEFEAKGFQVDLIRASVARADQVNRMFAEIEQKFGYLDILVNNSASGVFADMEEIDETAINRAFDTNLKGSFWCARHAAALMKKRGGGYIVNMSSLGSFLAVPDYLVVGTSKAALESLTRYLAQQYGPYNIKVNTASATLLENEVARKFPKYDEMCRRMTQFTPLGRIGQEIDLANLVMFLTSHYASFVTGQVLLADGGIALGGSLFAANSTLFEPATSNTLESEQLKLTSLDKEMQPVVTQPANIAASKELPNLASLPTPEFAPTIVNSDIDAKTITSNLDNTDLDNTEEIAVVGMGMVVPGANNPEEFWKISLEGPELFVQIPSDRWAVDSFYTPYKEDEDKAYQDFSGFITNFKPCTGLEAELGTTANLKEHEYTTLWLRHSLHQALEHVKRTEQDRYSFVVGYTADGVQHLQETTVVESTLANFAANLTKLNISSIQQTEWLEQARKTLLEYYPHTNLETSKIIPHRIIQNALQGILPETTQHLIVDTACSSSLYALDIGIKGLLTGRQDIAICGGAFSLAPCGSILFSKLNGLSVKGAVRSLDKDCDGVLFSDGAGLVVLKRLKRAVADGDKILGIISGFGASSDGKGKAIYAPSSVGQSLAVRRALDNTGIVAQQIDWVLAHATGTPAGDLTEFKTLRDLFADSPKEQPVYITSNKSLVGHTGWAAGVVSLIQMLLGLRNFQIPPQHRFSNPPESFEIESTNLKIPTEPVKWLPKPDGSPRIGTISGFGFGGTNGHLVVKEYLPTAPVRPAPARPYNERLAIVGWSGYLPGLAAKQAITDWLLGKGTSPVTSFGESYPPPSFQKVRLPPATIRTIDRCQLMILECAHQLQEQLGDFWDKYKENAGVIVGHMGLTRHGMYYNRRNYLDDMEKALQANPALISSQMESLTTKLFSLLREQVKVSILPSNEDSFPGIMPNVIPARVANYFNLKGLNMTVDTGYSSALTALEVACCYLASGELSFALVGGINGNTTFEQEFLLKSQIETAGEKLAEASFVFALARETTARQANLPILAYIDDILPVMDKTTTSAGSTTLVECGLGTTQNNYLAAEGALGLVKALVQLQDNSALQSAEVVCHTEDVATRRGIRLINPIYNELNSTSNNPITTQSSEAFANLPVPELLEFSKFAPGQTQALERYNLVLGDFPPQPLKDYQLGFGSNITFFAPQTLWLTDQPELLLDSPLTQHSSQASDSLVISTNPLPPDVNYPNWVFLPDSELRLEILENILKGFGGINSIQHLRVISSLNQVAPVTKGRLAQDATVSLKLHDLLFLAYKLCYKQIQSKQVSLIALFPDSIVGEQGEIHPLGGLFRGFLKCVALETKHSLVCAIFTDLPKLVQNIPLVETELSLHRYLPVVIYQQGQRKTYWLNKDSLDAQLTEQKLLPLQPDSLVVATAGARGITAEIMKTIAYYYRPHIYLLGSNPLNNYPPEYFDDTDTEFAARRAEYIRQQKAKQPSKNPAQLSKEFDRILEARAAYQNIQQMQHFCGVNKVHYLVCDVTNPAQLKAVFAQIRAAEKNRPIDLLINAAGINQASSIETKSLAEFRKVRDLKLTAYLYLKELLADYTPRLWCNFSSLIALVGHLGEYDYGSANDFLDSATTVAAANGQAEFCIGWSVWKSVGLAAAPVLKSLMERNPVFTSMSTEEGLFHFLRELNLPNHAKTPVTYHMGQRERFIIENERVQGFFTASQKTPEQVANYLPSKGRFYLEREVARTSKRVEFERSFDLEKDSYLQEHLVNGYATLPGMFILEMAVEAALALKNNYHVVAIEDISFDFYLRVYKKDKPSLKRIIAEVIEPDEISDSNAQITVAVKILTDIIAPNGTILTKDKQHAAMKVKLAKNYPSTPLWQKWDSSQDEFIPDPYLAPESPVHLTGSFVSTKLTRQHPLGKRAVYSFNPSVTKVYEQFILPAMLLDGLARIAALTYTAKNQLPLAAPLKIKRITFYQGLNDVDLKNSYPSNSIELYACPQEVIWTNQNKFVAVCPENKLLLQMEQLEGVITGYIQMSVTETKR